MEVTQFVYYIVTQSNRCGGKLNLLSIFGLLVAAMGK